MTSKIVYQFTIIAETRCRSQLLEYFILLVTNKNSKHFMNCLPQSYHIAYSSTVTLVISKLQEHIDDEEKL